MNNHLHAKEISRQMHKILKTVINPLFHYRYNLPSNSLHIVTDYNSQIIKSSYKIRKNVFYELLKILICHYFIFMKLKEKTCCHYCIVNNPILTTTSITRITLSMPKNVSRLILESIRNLY